MIVSPNGDIIIRKGNSEILSLSSSDIGDCTAHTWTCNVRSAGSNTLIFAASVVAASATSINITFTAVNTALLTPTNPSNKYEYVVHYVSGATAKTLICQNVTVLEGV